MKTALTIFLVIGFSGVAVFGMFAMNHGAEYSHSCFAATVQGTDCPKEADPLDFAAFHIDAYKELSLSTFGESAMSTLLAAFALLLFISFAFSSPRLFNPPQLALYRRRFRDPFSPPQEQGLTGWLALHENSPATL